MGRRAVQPDLLFIQSRGSCRVRVEGDPQYLRDVRIFDGQLPSQEDLAAVLPGRKIGRMEAVSAPRNDGVGLGGIKDHHRAPDQRDALARGREVHVQPPVLAQEEIAEGRTAIVGCIMVVLRAATGHQGYVTGGQHVPQTACARPVGCRLHAVLVVRPAHTRLRQRQGLYVSGFQPQALRYVPLPIRDQPCRWRRDVDHIGEHGITHATTTQDVATPEKGREAVWRRTRLRGAAHRGQCTQGRVRYFSVLSPERLSL